MPVYPGTHAELRGREKINENIRTGMKNTIAE